MAIIRLIVTLKILYVNELWCGDLTIGLCYVVSIVSRTYRHYITETDVEISTS